MLDDDSKTLRTVAWSEICPWLVIFRTFGLACGLRTLVLAAVATLVTLIGWTLFGWVFSGDPDAVEWMGAAAEAPWAAIDAAVPNGPEWPGMPKLTEKGLPDPATWQAQEPFFGSWAVLSRPLWETFHLDVTVTRLACLLLYGLWALAVWAFFGAAITRIAAVRLAADEWIGWGAALRFACSKWLSYFAAPLLPLACVLVIAVPAWVLGWIMRWIVWAEVGVLLAAVVWPLVLLAGFLMVVLLLGLVFGWPLMWATISTEGTDCFDALQRSYDYVFHRPLHYLFYAVVAAGFGVLSWLLVKNVAAGIIGLSYWSAALSAGFVPDNKLIHFWVGGVKLLAFGFVYGYFWTASTAIYLLLRRDADATEMDEVFLDEDASEQTYGLPPLKTDEAGAPVVEDDVPEVEPDDEEPAAEKESDKPQQED